jgi:hypothetical protein
MIAAAAFMIIKIEAVRSYRTSTTNEEYCIERVVSWLKVTDLT